MGEGLTIAGIERLHAAAERHVGATRVPGLVALVARGAQVHVEALGSLAVDSAGTAGSARPGPFSPPPPPHPTPHTHWLRICSITRTNHGRTR